MTSSDVVCFVTSRQWKLFNWWSAKGFWWSAQGRQRVRYWSHWPHLHSCR